MRYRYQNKIHTYLEEKKIACPNIRKQKKGKRCRYKRKHSLSLLHADWMEYGGKKVIAYSDDSSTYDQGSKKKQNQWLHLSMVPSMPSTQTEDLSFYANKWGKKGKGKSQFEKYLERKRIKHIPSRKGNPQTNGKLERWFQEYTIIGFMKMKMKMICRGNV